jgi:hypothetical protein
MGWRPGLLAGPPRLGRHVDADSVGDLIQRPDDAQRRIDLLKLAERLGLNERAAAYLVDAPFEQGGAAVDDVRGTRVV